LKKGRGLFNISEILEITGGTLIQEGKQGQEIRGVSIDSREMQESFLFIPLPGENTDGHRYLRQALQARASCVLVSRRWMEEEGESTRALLRESVLAAAVVVEEPLKALKDLAKRYLKDNSDFNRVGITGSNGKTTTKEIVANILSQDKPTWKNPGNFNSEIGLPLACFSVNRSYGYGVFEMGMNHPGEIDFLVDLVDPELAVITNIGTAHIGLLGSQESIAWEKKRIFSRFSGQQKAFVFEEDPFKEFLSRDVKGRVYEFGRGSTPGFLKAESLGIRGTKVTFQEGEIMYPLFGEHNLQNLLCAVRITREMGLDFGKIKAGAETVKGLFGRSEVLKGEITLIQDCYNANFDSMVKALQFLQEIPWKGRKVLILGAMRELGVSSSSFHRALGEYIAQYPFNGIFLFGEEMDYTHKALCERGIQGVCFFREYGELESQVLAFLKKGDLVLVKGSRSLELERLTRPLKEVFLLGREESV